MAGMGEDEPPLSELVGKLVDEGKAYARAEMDLAKAKANAEARKLVARYRAPALLGLFALLFAIGGITTFCVMTGIMLAQRFGPATGTIAGTLIALLIALILGQMAKRKLEAGGE